MSTIIQGQLVSKTTYNFSGFIDRDIEVNSFVSSVSTSPFVGTRQQAIQGAGPTGSLGPTGAVNMGATGPSGIQGATGPRGITGPIGYTSVGTGPTGPPEVGPSGIIGATAGNGPTGSGITFLGTIQVPGTTVNWTTSSFSSIPQTFQNLRIIGNFLAGPANCNFRLNSDNGSNYDWQLFAGNFEGFGPTSVNGVASTSIPLLNFSSGSPLAPIIIDIPTYSSTNNYKTVTYFLGIGGKQDEGLGKTVNMLHGTWRNTAAITSITFFADSLIEQAFISLDLYGY